MGTQTNLSSQSLAEKTILTFTIQSSALEATRNALYKSTVTTTTTWQVLITYPEQPKRSTHSNEN